MSALYSITVIPYCRPEESGKAELESLTFIASNGKEQHRWWVMSDRDLVNNFSEFVGSSAIQIVNRLRRGESVTLPGFFALDDIRHKIADKTNQ